ncbi:MAG: hypothetical protein IJ866_02700 [Alphaproteobacteria bacterium]|nr:hypothetical protein [Alphaproteobacteria bacterium]
MKKLTASIFTVLLATIGTANADIASQAYVDKQTGTLTNLTTTAKDNLVGAINELNTKAGNKSVATQIAEALVPYSTTEQSDAAYATAAQGAKADTAVQPAAISDMQIKSNLVTSMSESSTDTQYPSAKAVYTAVEAAKTAATYDDTALSAKVTANETAISTINSSAPMTSGITQAKVGQYDTLVTNAASYGDIVTHDADEFATAAQGTKADSAVQSVTKSGEGNILTGITTTDHAVTVTVSGTAIPQPSGSCKDCVLHYNGKAYSWEEITR